MLFAKINSMFNTKYSRFGSYESQPSIEQLVEKYGFEDVFFAVCKYANNCDPNHLDATGVMEQALLESNLTMIVDGFTDSQFERVSEIEYGIGYFRHVFLKHEYCHTYKIKGVAGNDGTIEWISYTIIT